MFQIENVPRNGMERTIQIIPILYMVGSRDHGFRLSGH